VSATRLLLAAVLFLSTVAAASAERGGKYPVFGVAALSHELGTTDTVLFSIRNLQAAPAPAVLSILIPNDYRLAALGSPDAGTNNLVVVAKDGHGAQTTYEGSLGNPTENGSVGRSSKACLRRKHAFVWRPTIDSENKEKHLLVPVTFDRTISYSQALVCLDALEANGLHAVEVIVSLRLRQPTRAGLYSFSTYVAPFAPNGEADTKKYYELRAGEILPLRMTLGATYSKATKILKVSGRVTIKNKPWADADVLLSALGGSGFTDLGDARVQPDGTFTRTRKLGSPPSRVGAYIPGPVAAGCSVSTTSAPAGCRSETLDGIQRNDVPVTVTK
jgi:hypothetical protein